MESSLGSVFFGLASAVVWGGGDFCGGLGARRASVFSVLVVAQLAGLTLLVTLGLLLHESVPSTDSILFCIVGGLSGTVGMAALYRGLAIGRASVVAPLSAVIAALVSGLYSLITLGLPTPVKLVGFVVALIAIVLVSQSAHGGTGARSLWLALISGIGFGGFFVLIHLGGSSSTFIPLAIARAVTIPLVLIAALIRHDPIPPLDVFPILILSGLLDAGGNVFFLIASQLGRLDVATILSSLYPASTVVLSRVILGERITRIQQMGVIAALLAVVLIAA